MSSDKPHTFAAATGWLRRISLIAAMVALVSGMLASCASDPMTRQQLRQVKTISVNSNVDTRPGGFAESPQIKSMEKPLVESFLQKLNQAGIFPRPAVSVQAPLQTWRQEVGEMNYDGQIKLAIRPASKDGQWKIEAVLETRAGSIIWRSSKTVNAAPQGLDLSLLSSACKAMVADLRRARG